MSGVMSRALQGALIAGTMCGVANAKRPEYGAFIDVKQVGEMQLAGSGTDDVTYTEVTGNVNAQVSNRRIVASANYRLSYRIPEFGNLDKTTNQDGVARIQAIVVDDWVTMDAGGIITHSRIDPSGSAPQTNRANSKNLTQTYSAFIQPALTHRFGDLGVGARYRYGYTKNVGRNGDSTPTVPITDRFDSSVTQEAALNIGMANSALPFDWQLTGTYQGENTSNLAKHSRENQILLNLTQPVAATVAVVGSIGYDTNKISERRALVDPLTGIPVTTSKGKFVADPASPRVLTYDFSGITTDVGILWRPSRRTRIELRGGYRYGGASVTASVNMQPSERTSFTLAITDRIESFGSGLGSGLAASSPNLNLGQIDPNDPSQNCLIGQTGGASCIGNTLGQASARSYRERALDATFSHALRWGSIGASFGYSRRTYIDDPTSPFSLNGSVDQSFIANLSLNRRLTRVSGLTFSFNGNLFKNGAVGQSDVMAGSFDTGYYRSFGRNIQLQANLSLDASKEEGSTPDVSGRAQLGLQYRF